MQDFMYYKEPASTTSLLHFLVVKSLYYNIIRTTTYASGFEVTI